MHFNENSSPLFARAALIAFSIFAIECSLIVVRFKARLNV